jgi:hypothetical protein
MEGVSDRSGPRTEFEWARPEASACYLLLASTSRVAVDFGIWNICRRVPYIAITSVISYIPNFEFCSS